ncbi:MAG TPA: ATP-binding protein [Petrotogaceae bacterium]|nr:ATP-binding protein [Petrotogaceae bacterium]
MSIFHDRLEILSHGGLPSGMTKEQFFDGISKPRNATLMRIFLNMGLTEHTGHGIPTIVQKYGTEVFEIESNYIRCTIPFEKEVMNQIDNKNVGLNVGLNKTEKKVIELLIENPSITSVELAEKIGVTKRTIERTFKSLQEKKMIERIGSKRDGNWIVVR